MPTVRIKAKLDGDGRGFHNMMNRAKKSSAALNSTLAKTFAGFFALGFLTRATQKTIDWGSATSDIATALGITTERVQTLEFALRKTGGSVDDVQKSFARLSQARIEALQSPTSTTSKQLSAIGITREDLKNFKTTEEFFDALAEIFNKRGFGANEQGLAKNLFGRSGLNLLVLFKEGLKEIEQEARDIGVVVGDDIVSQLDTLKDKQEQLIQQIRGPWATAIVTITDHMIDFQRTVEEVGLFIGVMMTELGKGFPQFGKDKANFSNIAEAQLRANFPAAKADTGPITPAIAGVIGAIVAGFHQGKRVNIENIMEQASLMAIARENVRADALAQRREMRENAAGDFDSVMERLSATPGTVKGDKLARIGGFTGRGNIKVEGMQERIARAAERTATNTKDTAEAIKEFP